MAELFVPKDFIIPQKLETDSFRLRPLTADDLEKDYDAVITSLDHLQGVFGERSNWPPYNLTIEKDLHDLEWHENEFKNRSSFAYTVVSLDESQCLGCMYIYPSRDEHYETDVYSWVRQSEYEKGLDDVLFQTIKHWIETCWPFRKVRYPGRS